MTYFPPFITLSTAWANSTRELPFVNIPRRRPEKQRRAYCSLSAYSKLTRVAGTDLLQLLQYFQPVSTAQGEVEDGYVPLLLERKRVALPARARFTKSRDAGLFFKNLLNTIRTTSWSSTMRILSLDLTSHFS